MLLLWLALAVPLVHAEPDPVLPRLNEAVERREAGDLEGSARAMQEALLLAEDSELIEPIQQAQLWMAQCGVLDALAKEEEALAACDRALDKAIAHGAGIRWVEGQVRTVRANVLRSLGRVPEAGQEIAAALVLLRKPHGFDEQYVQAELLASTMAHAEGDVAAALEHIDQAMTHVEAHPAEADRARSIVLQTRANTLVVAGRPGEAAALHATVLAERSERLGPKHLDTVMARADYAVALQYAGRWDESNQAFAEVVADLEAVLPVEDPYLARLRAEWTVALTNVHRLAEARLQGERAVAVLSRGADPDMHALALARLADVHESRGDRLRARDAYERALALMIEVNGEGSTRVASTRGLLAGTYANLGDRRRAAELYDQALPVLEEALGIEHPEVAVFRSRRAMSLTEPAASVAAQREAIAVLERTVGPDHVTLVPTRRHLVIALIRAGQLAEAQVEAEAALAHAESAFHPRHAAVFQARYQVLRVRALRGDAADVLAEAEAAVQGYRETHDAGSPVLSSDIARLAHLAGQPLRAAGHARLALADLGRQRPSFLVATSERERLEYLQNTRLVLDTWLSLDTEAPAVAAWKQVMHAKGLVARSLAVQNTVLRQGESTEVQDLFDRLTDLRSRVAALARDPDEAIRASVLATEKDRIERALYERLDADLLEMPDVGAICRSLPLGSTLVDYYRATEPTLDGRLRQDHYLAFVVEADTCRVHRFSLGDASPIDEAIERYRSALRPGVDPTRLDALGAEVRSLIFDPLRAAIGASHQVVVVPDGAVATVSFAGLPTARPGHYLVERMRFSYADGAAGLLDPPAAAAQARAVVLGGVQYPEVTEEHPCQPGRLEPLPATRVEAEQVAAALTSGGLEVTTLLGTEATRVALAQAATGARVVHLATHGWTASSRCRSALQSEEALGYHPMALSGLALADGLWTAEEVAGIDLSGVELAVLSACGTGLGEDRPGEGVLGLRRAVATAGAQAQLTALWAIPDDVTQALMADLYAGMRPGRTRWALLLRRAQLRRLRAARRTGDAQVWTWAGLVFTGG